MLRSAYEAARTGNRGRRCDACVLLWQGVRGAMQKAEGGVELRNMQLKDMETRLVARNRALEHREEAVTRQEAALAALMPRLQAVARMESAMAAIIPHLKVSTPAMAAAESRFHVSNHPDVVQMRGRPGSPCYTANMIGGTDPADVVQWVGVGEPCQFGHQSSVHVPG